MSNNTKKRRNQGFCIRMRDDVKSVLANARAELKHGLLEFCIRSGFLTMAEMLDEEITALCGGSWYEHGIGCEAYRWGKTGGEVVLGGRKVKVRRQRLRDFTGHEVMPSVYRHFRDEDRLSVRVMAQLLAGV